MATTLHCFLLLLLCGMLPLCTTAYSTQGFTTVREFGAASNTPDKTSVVPKNPETTTATTPLTAAASDPPLGTMVQLVNGNNRCNGRVEVLYEGTWGTICANGWQAMDARVVCSEINCGSVYESNRFFGPGSGSILLNNVQCTGNEYTLALCSYNVGNPGNCSHWDDVGVVCSETAATHTTGNTPTGSDAPVPQSIPTIPMINTTTIGNTPTGYGGPVPEVPVKLVNSGNRCTGRVEVFFNGMWGTICDNGWQAMDALVVCRQLNCGSVYQAGGFVLVGTGPILLNNVQCTGNENSIFECDFSVGNPGNCSHLDDVTITCSDAVSNDILTTTEDIITTEVFEETNATEQVTSTTLTTTPTIPTQTPVYNRPGYYGTGLVPTSTLTTNPTPTTTPTTVNTPTGYDGPVPELSVRLVNGDNRCQGRVQVFWQGYWGTVCNHEWQATDALVLCRQLNCGFVYESDSFFGPGSGPILLNNVQCTGNENSLEECNFNVGSLGNCSHSDDVGIICSDFLTTTEEMSTTRGLRFTATTMPGSLPCGSVLSQQYGNFTSSFNPYNLPTGSPCQQQIKVKQNYCIKVIFTIMNLQDSNDCTASNIAVYDGPSNTSPPLALVCTNSSYSVTSTSNVMTIEFSGDGPSDSEVQATYYAYACGTNDRTALTCSAEYMQVVIPKSFIDSLGYTATQLSLIDPYCYPEVLTHLIVFNIPYDGCYTMKKVDNDTITYSNSIRANPSGEIITRQKKLNVDVHCRMSQETMLEVMYVADDIVGISQTENDHFDVTLSIYASSLFDQPVVNSLYHINLNQEVYLEATLHTSDPNLQLFVDTCEASSNDGNFSSETYYLIRNGCVRDSTYQTYSSPSAEQARFSFRAFKFLDNRSFVFLRCKLVVCNLYDYSSRCYQGCFRRKKRSPGPYRQEVEVTVGPFQLTE